MPPFLSIAITPFALPEDALAVLEAFRQAPNDRPTPGPLPRGFRTAGADPDVPGAKAALAFTAAMDGSRSVSAVDSAGVSFVVGDVLVSIDVQGGLSGHDALAAAIDLATQQAACLTSGGTCTSVTRPATLGNV
jgi:hypothetical protein